MTTALREKVRSLKAVTPVRGGGFLFFYRLNRISTSLSFSRIILQNLGCPSSARGLCLQSGRQNAVPPIASVIFSWEGGHACPPQARAARRRLGHGLPSQRNLTTFICYLLIATLSAQAATYYVSPSGNDAISGASLGLAKRTIQAAIDVAVNGDTVLVADGTYSPITIREAITVRSVNGAQTTIIDGGGVRCCVYLFKANAVLDGFTITNGFAHRAGGIDAYDGGIVRNCTISGNTAYYVAGGIYIAHGTIENCLISGNIVLYSGAPVGGVLAYYSTVRNCTIKGNRANAEGGGVWINGGMVQNCTISGNTAGYYGGGVYVLDGTLENCAITENTALWAGGGVTLINGTVKNCLISGNRADDLGGGVEAYGGLVENCTIVRNTVLSDDGSLGVGGGMYYQQAGTVESCIVYYNEGQDVMGANTLYISYSCLGTNIAGVGNITNEPQFVSLGTGYGPDHVPGNYRLRSTSPCINAGLNQSWMVPPSGIDLDNLPRILDGVVDMGAYEGLGANNAIMHNPAILYNQCNYGSNAASQTIEVWNAGTNAMAYALSADVSWLSLSPVSGTSAGEIDLVSVNYTTAALTPETYTGVVTITSADAINSPQVVTVYLTVDEIPQEDLADLEASDFRFLPVNLWAGDHPAMISFDLLNEGTADIVPPDTQLEIAFCLSSNTSFGDEDDLTIGTKTEELTLSAGSQTTVRYPGRAHNTDVTIPEGLSGDYYVFVSVRLVSQSGLSDPDGALAMREGPIRVRIHPSDDGDDNRQRSVLNDYDADGQSDMVDYDEESGEWLIQLSASGTAARFAFGGPDYEAVPGDYDGDFKADPAVHDGPAWQIMLSGLGYETVSFGFDVGTETRGAVGDYNGDELADPGLYEEQSGRWYALLQDKQGNFEIVSALFGGPGLAPVVGDYDGDSRADPAVYEEATGGWLVMLSAQRYGVVSAGFGGPGYRPVPADYDGDGKTDLAIMDASGGWYYRLSGRSYALSGPDEFGQSGQPVPGDYDGDGKSDPAVVSATGWYFWLSGSSYARVGPYALNGR